MEYIVPISAIISAISALVIACFAVATFRLSKEISAAGQRHQEQFSDLLQAIVVSNMTQQSGGGVSFSIENFKKYYSGKTILFS